MTPTRTGRAHPIRRIEGIHGATGALRVDTADCAPVEMARFTTMNPFHFNPRWRIPVPGSDRHAASVEGIWQGLKRVDGRTDLAMFERAPEKRPPDSDRGPEFDYTKTVFEYGEKIIDLVSARLLIYIPAYLYVLDHLVPEKMIEEIATALSNGQDVLFYDWDENFDVLDPTSSFSHSSLLAAWFGGRLEEEFLRHFDVRPRLELGRYHLLHKSGKD
jgi:hypothetical protein